MIFKKKKKKDICKFHIQCSFKKIFYLLNIDRNASKKISILKLSMVFNFLERFSKK